MTVEGHESNRGNTFYLDRAAHGILNRYDTNHNPGNVHYLLVLG